MSPSDRRRDELQRLASALCDGEISRDEAQRLKSLATRAPDALQHVLQYLELHAELAWTLGLVAEPAVTGPREPVLGVPRPGTAVRWTGVAVTVAVVLLVAVVFLALAILPGPAPRGPQLPASTVVATLTRSADATWSDDAALYREGARLVVGEVLRLESGLAEIRFDCGARVILDGRTRAANFELTSNTGGALQFGRLTANVPPRASGFTLGTPSATIIDLGTEIGVAVKGQGTSEIHVLTGNVQVRPVGPSDPSPAQDVSAGEAVRVAVAGGRARPVQEIPLAAGDFLRALPPRGPVEGLRGLVASDPHLIHHYPFEGLTRRDKCADRWSGLDLAEVRMHGGGGGLDIYESAPGLDRYTTALRPFRDGDAVGVGLQSRTAFEPPQNLTVELLLMLETSAEPADAMIASAVGFPTDPPSAGALGVAADRRRLVFRPGQNLPAGADPAVIEPDRWYYVAATFEAGEGRTTVNGYLADLKEGDSRLVQIAEDLVVKGVPARGRLGIGKGFDRDGADAYPWSGRLDEIAIYDAVLDRQTLQQHLAALLNEP